MLKRVMSVERESELMCQMNELSTKQVSFKLQGRKKVERIKVGEQDHPGYTVLLVLSS